ncbi:MAG: hypothetical protein H6841_03125 [Planctomycetes bacterium]|nr:hypothetical protein [Planctomycetota bacterium]MCB9934111.1 hypothetical protein [Planctomycetota bacterium]
MDPFEEHLLDRDLHEALGNDGPAPELKGRILDTVAGRPAARTRRPSGRVIPLPVKRTPWGAYVAAAATLLLAVAAFGWAMSRPSVPTSPTPVSQSNAPTRGEKPQQPAPAEPTPQPEPQPESQPQPEPQPEKVPDPVPEKGADPRPVPEPTPQPQPQPEKPDDVVNKSEPRPEPEKPDTEAKPDESVVVATVLGEAKLKFRFADSGDWLALNTSEVKQGWQLKADEATDLRLSNGIRVRFDGEVTINPGKLVLRGRHTLAYVDALGIEAPLAVTRDEYGVERDALEMKLSASEAFFDADGSSVEIFCYIGSVVAGETVEAGKRAKLSARGLGGLRDLKDSERAPRLLKDLSPRQLFSEQYDSSKGSYESCYGENACITLKLGNELTVVPGMQLRLRFKASKAGALYIQLQQQAGELQWGKWTKLDKNGEWLEWTIPFDELQRDDGRSEAPLAVGNRFKTINLFIQDGAEAELQLDWVEIVRVR